MCGTVWVDGSTDTAYATRAQEEIDLYFTGECVLRQKQACREAVEKCRAGRGAQHTVGRDIGIIQDYNTTNLHFTFH